jgi:hypothetical protein
LAVVGNEKDDFESLTSAKSLLKLKFRSTMESQCCRMVRIHFDWWTLSSTGVFGFTLTRGSGSALPGEPGAAVDNTENISKSPYRSECKFPRPGNAGDYVHVMRAIPPPAPAIHYSTKKKPSSPYSS